MREFSLFPLHINLAVIETIVPILGVVFVEFIDRNNKQGCHSYTFISQRVGPLREDLFVTM